MISTSGQAGSAFRKSRNVWRASLNPDAMPRLRINRSYADAVSGAGHSFLSKQLQEARWLLRSMEQRLVTIQRVAEAIVQFFREEFIDHIRSKGCPFSSVPLTWLTPRTTAGFSSAGTLAAQECTISSVRSRSRPTSTPINAAGTNPKFESAE